MFSDATYSGRVKKQLPASDFTTLRVGGPVDYFVEVISLEELLDVVNRAKQANAKLVVLGEGSNVIIKDEGIRGVVVKLEMSQQKIEETDDSVLVTVEAGVNWDQFVGDMVANGFAGVEAMSGVPGTVGAAPVQNIGCYGQELADVFVSLLAYDTVQNRLVTFTKKQCKFGYRTSCFKQDKARRYIIVSLTLELSRQFHKVPRYPDVEAYFLNKKIAKPTVKDVRQAVLEIRRNKSMVLDENDVNTRSVGSFFTNPVVSTKKLAEMVATYGEVPHYMLDGDLVKIPAAWLVERAGFVKGFVSGNVGISAHHSLAIINRGGATASEILSLGEQIQEEVLKVFGIELIREPQIIE